MPTQSHQPKIDRLFLQKKNTPQPTKISQVILSTEDDASDILLDSAIVPNSKPVPKKRKLYKASQFDNNENATTMASSTSAAKKQQQKPLPPNKNRRKTISVLTASNSDSDFVNPPPREKEKKNPLVHRRSSDWFDETKSLAYINKQPKKPPPPQRITGIVCSNLSNREKAKLAEVGYNFINFVFCC
jgi:hypothetical protein